MSSPGRFATTSPPRSLPLGLLRRVTPWPRPTPETSAGCARAR
eukprot:CAMPEP_0206283634 /NCGR_PEP_ID=MMETSP0047_2-20121206/40329_1 /ASSEMBLY_ACC=CAM_ASM_000192 /TAXON_ID=195065 /ORGANISM="Chroomonas mesostigmatica_cf, Strain CCMP1168" /LENGTH=42 /DNA_ID= /DNA_START= /DNA_END= /DNA_ORIENTATION=